MNITYLFGAGASANACPILRGLGEKMIALAKKFLEIELQDFTIKQDYIKPHEKILFDIGYFGTKALQYGTIDTYAKKLFLSDDYFELERLKFSVSLFFTIWESMNDDLKTKENFIDIDTRYISLLASLLQKTQSKGPLINENFKFVSWNYDLQFERAYKSFCRDHYTMEDVSRSLKFRINGLNDEDLKICHLNGYNGYYSIELNADNTYKEIDTIDRILEIKDVPSIIKKLEFLVESQNRSQISFRNHVNYAWEKGFYAEVARYTALEILKKTDTLVIIGYSFPPFNKEIDQILFQALKERKTKIYYQDPNASEEFISTLVKDLDTEIHCITDKMDHFFLPYDY